MEPCCTPASDWRPLRQMACGYRAQPPASAPVMGLQPRDAAECAAKVGEITTGRATVARKTARAASRLFRSGGSSLGGRPHRFLGVVQFFARSQVCRSNYADGLDATEVGAAFATRSNGAHSLRALSPWRSYGRVVVHHSTTSELLQKIAKGTQRDRAWLRKVGRQSGPGG